jgi:predicted nucleic acid-binding protein
MKIIVDTNIVFSAVLNSSGKIGDLLLTSDDVFQFYTCDYLQDELTEHHEKLKMISKLSDEEISISKRLIFKHLHFINEYIIPSKHLIFAENIVADIDPNDSDFVALCEYLDCSLWSGDKKLHKGLLQKGYNKILLTNDLWELRQTLRL